jgi:DNA-binding LytR/AlgR family response regulator
MKSIPVFGTTYHITLRHRPGTCSSPSALKSALIGYSKNLPVQQIAATEIAPSATIEHLYFKTGNKTIKTQVDDIVYVEALKDYSIIYTSNDKIVTKGTLKYMEEILPTDGFLRVHKSYIIAKNKIIAVERTRVILTPQIAIPVGKTFQEKLKSYTRPGAK